ncbi:MAG: bifunctional diaminohydroxyphosphoribosylaminopyrimidine deaminase/5-amino-6-(5-phosphoribosylamino)uracil reductase RibD [Chloroflexi bacterium]|nr:bifunctional diaminohydroxyphosphoribosylaminopyrimidine deaminase/5-amino-6-(5-phosphoribosylamino)uracil reductase RibD [Chloroflexota bacterium]
MTRALALGRQALGLSSPNPAVGAVVVRQDGVIVGEGFTQPPGGPHAEAVALAQAGEAARGATLYTTLEPCAHVGRTPPCAAAIIEAGIREVRVAVLDPNQAVNGNGRRALTSAGIETAVGERGDEATEHFQGYFKHVRTGLPLVIVKYAMTLDGKIATRGGDSRWVSGEESRRRVHEVRSQVDAILTAPGTIAVDDPQLTARNQDGSPMPRQPLRVIADSRGRTPVNARVFREPGKTLVATAGEAYGEPFRTMGDSVLTRAFPDAAGRVDLLALLRYLGSEGSLHVLTEVGEVLLGALFDAGLPDRAMVFIAPSVVGGAEALSPVGGRGVDRMVEAPRLLRSRSQRLGDDVLIEGAFRWWDGGGTVAGV